MEEEEKEKKELSEKKEEKVEEEIEKAEMSDELKEALAEVAKTKEWLQWSYYGCIPMTIPAIIKYFQLRKNELVQKKDLLDIRTMIVRDLGRIAILVPIIVVIIVLWIKDI